jgi:hypothetical protein
LPDEKFIVHDQNTAFMDQLGIQRMGAEGHLMINNTLFICEFDHTETRKVKT